MAVSTNASVSTNAVDGAIDIVKIKTAGSGGNDGTFTNIPIRGDGTGGVVSVTVTSGAMALGSDNYSRFWLYFCNNQ